MERRDLTRADPPSTSALGASRTRVLEVLQAASAPVAIADVAEQTGLHPNTARFHLDGLVAADLAERATEERATPGRPRTLYSAPADDPAAGRRSYRLLAEILAGYLGSQSSEPRDAAIAAGEAWGRYLIDRPAPFQRVDDEEATEAVVEVLDDIGFAPEATATEAERQIQLHHCPFREAAVKHGQVVCGVHLGLMRGMLDELDASVGVERLDPFVKPTLCIAHLAETRR